MTTQQVRQYAQRATLDPDYQEGRNAEDLSGSCEWDDFTALSDIEIEDQAEDHNGGPLCLLAPDEILGESTICGSIGSKCFNQQVIDFMKENNATKIFVVPSYDSGARRWDIAGAVVNISGQAGEDLGNLVEANGGSWRAEANDHPWTGFESE